MPVDNDHDLLIQLSTKVDLVLGMLRDSNNQVATLNTRVSALENKDSRDSEKVSAISKDVQMSLHNSSRITALETQVKSLEDELSQLRGRGYSWDVINSVGIGVGTLIGYIFGGK